MASPPEYQLPEAELLEAGLLESDLMRSDLHDSEFLESELPADNDPDQYVKPAVKPSLDHTIEKALGWLDAELEEEGFWRGEFESNCCMEAEWIMAHHMMGRELPHRDKIVSGILSKQRKDGAFETYFDAPSGDVNSTVESYVALRIAGVDPESDAMRAAREWIIERNALDNIRVFTRYWLSLVGEWSWRDTPNLPPEIIRLPLWNPFNIYHFASWARATIVPLCVLSAMRFTKPLPEHLRPHELFPNGREAQEYRIPKRGKLLSWESAFRLGDRVLHKLQDWNLIPARKTAMALCLEWIAKHQDSDGVWGGIQPPWVYSLMALHASGYSHDHPMMEKGLSALDSYWAFERDGHRFIQACESPVWDTLLTLTAVQECDAQSRDSEQTAKAVEWILAHENRTRGDWSHLTPHAEPGGWAFERANQHYPDLDDTAVAILMLARLEDPELIEAAKAPLQRAINWVFAMQSDNGGWAAFDRNNDSAILTKIPFCDFGEVLDPPSADVTAHMVEALISAGYTRDNPQIASAVDYIWSTQEPGGGWFGRWGVNYIYGTAAVLPALAAIGEDMTQERVRCAEMWITSQQNEDGGWGETCASYMDHNLAGSGVSTASQTGWALMALLAGNHPSSAQAIRKGLDFLKSTQENGSWNEKHYTGTGFPGYGFGAQKEEEGIAAGQGPELTRAFMINYNMYRHYFPMIALGRARELGHTGS